MLQQPYNPHPLSQFVITLKTHQTLKRIEKEFSVILPVKREKKMHLDSMFSYWGGGGISPSNIIKEVLEEQLLSEGMTGYHCTLTCVQVYGKIVFPPNMTY